MAVVAARWVPLLASSLSFALPSQVHRLLITAIMLASKFFDDVYYNNAVRARRRLHSRPIAMAPLRSHPVTMALLPHEKCVPPTASADCQLDPLPRGSTMRALAASPIPK